MSKKGLSPVIASILLVALVLVLGTIIYLWASAFIPEVIEKSGEPIENSCADVVFDASYVIYDANDLLTVQNNGNVPIWGVRYGIEQIGSLVYHDQYKTIGAGGSWQWSVGSLKAVVQGEDIRVIPMILGKASTGESKAFACEDSMKIVKAQDKTQ